MALIWSAKNFASNTAQLDGIFFHLEFAQQHAYASIPSGGGKLYMALIWSAENFAVNTAQLDGIFAT